MSIHYPKLRYMTHTLSLMFSLLSKELTLIFLSFTAPVVLTEFSSSPDEVSAKSTWSVLQIDSGVPASIYLYTGVQGICLGCLKDHKWRIRFL